MRWLLLCLYYWNRYKFPKVEILLEISAQLFEFTNSITRYKIISDSNAKRNLISFCIRQVRASKHTIIASARRKNLAKIGGTYQSNHTWCIIFWWSGSTGVSDCRKAPLPNTQSNIRYTMPGPICKRKELPTVMTWQKLGDKPEYNMQSNFPFA